MTRTSGSALLNREPRRLVAQTILAALAAFQSAVDRADAGTFSFAGPALGQITLADESASTTTGANFFDLPVTPAFQLSGQHSLTVDGTPSGPLEPGSVKYEAGLYGALTPSAGYLAITDGSFVSYTSPEARTQSTTGFQLDFRSNLGTIFFADPHSPIDPVIVTANFLVSGTLAPGDSLHVFEGLKAVDPNGNTRGQVMTFNADDSTSGKISIPFTDSTSFIPQFFDVFGLEMEMTVTITSHDGGQNSTVVIDPGAGFSQNPHQLFPFQPQPAVVAEPSSILEFGSLGSVLGMGYALRRRRRAWDAA